MTLVVDASALYSQADERDPNHPAVRSMLEGERAALATTEAVANEADHLILARLGFDVEIAFLDDLANGTFAVACLSLEEIGAARRLVEQYGDLTLGFADASLVVLAARLGTRRLATLDERSFRAVSPLQGGTFTLLPADA